MSYVFYLNAVMIPPKVYAQKPNSLSGKLVLFDRCIHLTRKPRVLPIASFVHEGFRPDLYSFRPGLDLYESLIRLELF